MAELDTIEIFNPTSEDFSHKYNGEIYSIKANSSKYVAQYVGFHIAKHLSNKVTDSEFRKKHSPEALKTDAKLQGELSQLMVFDNPLRRISLYRILKNKDFVERVIKLYHLKGFIGDMKEYDDFVVEENVSMNESHSDSSSDES